MPASWDTCVRVTKQQLGPYMEQLTIQNWERSITRLYTLSLFNLYADYIIRNAGLDELQAGIKTDRRNISNIRYADDTTLMAESEEELKSLLMRMKE